MTFIFVFTLSMNGFYEWLNIGIRFFSGWNAILPTTWQWNVSKTSAKHEQKLWDIIIVRVRMFLFTWMASSCFGFNAIGIHTHTRTNALRCLPLSNQCDLFWKCNNDSVCRSEPAYRHIKKNHSHTSPRKKCWFSQVTIGIPTIGNVSIMMFKYICLTVSKVKD